MEESQAGIKITRINISNFRYAESEEELKRLLKREKVECEKADLKLNIQKTKIIASGHNTSWQIEGEKVENSDRFYFLGFPNHCGW